MPDSLSLDPWQGKKPQMEYSLQVRSPHRFYALWFCSTKFVVRIWKVGKAVKNCQGVTEPQRLQE